MVHYQDGACRIGTVNRLGCFKQQLCQILPSFEVENEIEDESQISAPSVQPRCRHVNYEESHPRSFQPPSPPMSNDPGYAQPDHSFFSSSSAIPDYLERPPLEARIHQVDLRSTRLSRTGLAGNGTQPHEHAGNGTQPHDQVRLLPPPRSNGLSPLSLEQCDAIQYRRYRLPPSQLPLVQVSLPSQVANSPVYNFASSSAIPPLPSYNNHLFKDDSPASARSSNSSDCMQYSTYHLSHVSGSSMYNSPPLVNVPPTHSSESPFGAPSSCLSIDPLSDTNVSQARAAGIRPKDLLFRPLEPKDFKECQQLHKEWFPITYEKNFYDCACRGDIYSLAAIYTKGRNHRSKDREIHKTCYHQDHSQSCYIDHGQSCSREHGQSCRHDNGQSCSREHGQSCYNDHRPTATNGDEHIGCNDSEEEYIAGIITLSQRPNLHLRPDDVELLLHRELADAIRSTPAEPLPTQPADAPLIRKDFKVDLRFHLAYILTLGVADNFRGIGLASELIRKAISFFVESDPDLRIVYLHVAGYNRDAIRLYDRLGFRCVHRYHVRGVTSSRRIEVVTSCTIESFYGDSIQNRGIEL